MNQQPTISKPINILGKPSDQHRAIESLPHQQYVAPTKQIRRIVWITAVLCIAQFGIFKFFYPYPDFISDSYNYVDTARLNLSVNLWPVGYAKFLWLIHGISPSDTFLVAVQYFMLEAALAYFFFTIVAIYHPKKNTRIGLYLFFFTNPLFLFLSNCILSDALFTTISILFFTQFLRMFYRPTLSQVVVQGLIIGLAFTIRYTAIYYPVVSLVGLLLSQQKIYIKLVGSLLGVMLIVPFVLFTKQKTQALTGTSQFSVFGGWQLANNALYMYDHIRVDSSELPPETRVLDRMTKQFFAAMPDSNRQFSSFTGGYFLKVPFAPLKQYLFQHTSFEGPVEQFKAWGQVSPIYQTYGKALVQQYPVAFARYYLLPNIKNYLIPPLEKFETYNLMTTSVPTAIQDWFGYVTPGIAVISYTLQGKLLYLFPLLFFVLNVFFIGFLAWIFVKRRWNRWDQVGRNGIYFATLFIALNAGFSAWAAPVVLRYEIVPFILLWTFTLLLLEGSHSDKANLSSKSKSAI